MMPNQVNITIDGVAYDVENVTYTKKKGLELNESTFNVSDSNVVIPFNRGEVVDLTITDVFSNNVNDTFLLQSDKTETYSFVSGNTGHDISVIERTYKLEKYTRVTRQYVDNGVRTLWDITDELRLTVPFVQDADLITTRLFTLSSNLDVLKNFIAPDMTFSDFTLRECLITVFDEAGAYPVLKEGSTLDELDIVFYNQRLNKVNLDTDNVYKTQDANSNEYASIYDANVSNLVNTASTIGGAIFDPVEGQYKGLRSDEGTFTSTNSYLESELSKYKKTRVQMRVPTNTVGTLVIDITENIVETQVYATLIEDAISPDNIIFLYRSNALIWDFAKNRINNFFETVGIFSQDTRIERVIKSGLTRYFVQQGDDPITASTKAISEYVQQEYYELEFNLIYTPDYNARMQVERLDTDDVNKIASKTYNQSANLTSPARLLRSMFSTIEKKSNTKVITSMNTDDLSTLYDLDYYTADGYVLTEIQIEVGHYDFTINYGWTKNDNKVSDRRNINSKLELFGIPAEDRQLTRNEYISEYIYATTTTLPTEDNTALNEFGLNVILETLSEIDTESDPTRPNEAYDKAPLGAALFSSETELYEDPQTGVSDTLSGTQRIVKPIQSWGGGNSLNLFYTFDSASIAGQERVEINSTQTLRAFRYTDKKGELVNLDVDFCHAYNTNIDTYPLINTPLTDVSVQLNDLVWYLNSAEIEALTYAIHVLPIDSSLIVFGQKFYERNFFVEWRDGGFPTLFASQCSSRYEKYETKVKDVTASAGGWNVNNGVVGLDSSNTAESWVISDLDGNVYMAVNQRQLDGSFVTASSITFGKYKNRIGMEVL